MVAYVVSIVPTSGLESEIKSVQDSTSAAGCGSVTSELEVTNLRKNTIVTTY